MRNAGPDAGLDLAGPNAATNALALALASLAGLAGITSELVAAAARGRGHLRRGGYDLWPGASSIPESEALVAIAEMLGVARVATNSVPKPDPNDPARASTVLRVLASLAPPFGMRRYTASE